MTAINQKWLAALIVTLAATAACGATESDTTSNGASDDPSNGASNDAGRPASGVIQYGAAAPQHATLGIPQDFRGRALPTVVLIHGGFWRERYTADLMVPLAEDLQRRGYATWNVEYRKVGEPGGGYPGTLDDIAAAIDHLGTLAADGVPIDLNQIVVVGHSAGGHLSLWSATRDAPTVTPMLVVGQAPVADLIAGTKLNLGSGAIIDFIGAPPETAAVAYHAASPAARLPIGVEQLIVQGGRDDIVPAAYVKRYVELVKQSNDNIENSNIEYLEFSNADHFDLIDPAHRSWQAVIDALPPVD